MPKRPIMYEPIVPGTGHACRSMHILIAEACPREQLRLLVILSRLGHTVRLAEDGLEMVQVLRDREIDLVLMDWELRVLDAETAIRRMRDGAAGERALRVPVVVMVKEAEKHPEILQRVETAGARGVLSKPAEAGSVERLLAALVQGAA